jgi:hypothetical protein
MKKKKKEKDFWLGGPGGIPAQPGAGVSVGAGEPAQHGPRERDGAGA